MKKMNCKAIYLIFSITAYMPFSVNAQGIKLCGTIAQGKIVTGYAPNAKSISFNNQNVKLTKDGKFIIAFSRDDNLNHILKVKDLDNKITEHSFKIAVTKWDVQDLKGVEQKKVTPSKEDEAEIDRERKDIRSAQQKTSDEMFWQQSFMMPVEGRISGNFGGQRIMNGKKMNPHMGMDIAAIQGTPIKAPADGIVTLSGDNNYFYSGNVIVVNHGYNLYTIYAHLLNTKVKAGDKVKKGDILGTVGKTGRVTGAHLHWGGSLNGIRFDPKSLLNKDDICIDL